MSTEKFTPKGMAYGYWHFGDVSLRDLLFDVELLAGDEPLPGRFYQLYQGSLGDIGFYFGFQNDVRCPRRGWQGKGLIFSRWKTLDASDAQTVPDGWLEIGTYEDHFVSVRSSFDWTLGRYECSFVPTRDDPYGVWYEFRVRRLLDGCTASAGSLRFPWQNRQRPAIQSGGISWMEVYSAAERAEDVPLSHMRIHSVRANERSVGPVRCDTDYNQRFPLADCQCSPEGILDLRAGFGVQRIHPTAHVPIKSR